jgi:hypothetical protein
MDPEQISDNVGVVFSSTTWYDDIAGWVPLLRSLRLGCGMSEGKGVAHLQSYASVIRQVRAHINTLISRSFARSTSKGLSRNHITSTARPVDMALGSCISEYRFLKLAPYRSPGL